MQVYLNELKYYTLCNIFNDKSFLSSIEQCHHEWLYNGVCSIKKKNFGYKPTKSKVFTVLNISRLYNENQHPDWLVIKVFDFRNLIIS